MLTPFWAHLYRDTKEKHGCVCRSILVQQILDRG
jgi:hypothetical protein